MKKILITGGAGFIGFHLANHLSNRIDNDITIIDNFEDYLNSSQFDILFNEKSNSTSFYL